MVSGEMRTCQKLGKVGDSKYHKVRSVNLSLSLSLSLRDTAIFTQADFTHL